MPIAILLIGVLLVVVGINDKMSDLGTLVKEDFAPTDGATAFHIWIVAIFIAGSLGYIRSFRPVANAFLVLIVISLLLSNRGFFARFTSAVRS